MLIGFWQNIAWLPFVCCSRQNLIFSACCCEVLGTSRNSRWVFSTLQSDSTDTDPQLLAGKLKHKCCDWLLSKAHSLGLESSMNCLHLFVVSIRPLWQMLIEQHPEWTGALSNIRVTQIANIAAGFTLSRHRSYVGSTSQVRNLRIANPRRSVRKLWIPKWHEMCKIDY
jgi:hypothetical protein